MAIFDDLEAELDRLEGILSGLDDRQWTAPSGADGWTVSDVVLHLAQSEEAVVASATGASEGRWPASGAPVDAVADQLVQAERSQPAPIFERWRTARRGAVAALRAAGADQPLPWVAAPLKPATLATDRLSHVAWLAHRTLPYAFTVAGQEPHQVRCELTAPDGVTVWEYGPAGAGSVISGPAGAFCRVAAQRLSPRDSGLTATGPYGPAALKVVRTYAA